MTDKTCHISESLQLPLSVVTLAQAVVGVRGSGKTNTGVVVAEDLLAANQQIIVIDPLDVWWGLKSSADGKRAGYPITVLGGPHGDVPLNAADGRTVADFLAENRVPAILSMRHLRKGEQRRFVADFAEQLFHRKGEQDKKTPVLVIIDEASQFCPQRVMGEDARMVGAIQDIVRLGRSSGLGAMLIDQRPASINKDVLTQIELLVSHRITSPQDRKALQAWVQAKASPEQEAQFLAGLATLKRGEAYFWSPEWLDLFDRVTVRARRTFDSSATPKGEGVTAPKTLASVDLDALKTKLAASIEKAKAEDPKELKKTIEALRGELKTAQSKPAATQGRMEVREAKVVEKPVIDEKLVARLEKLAERIGFEGSSFLNRQSMLAESLMGKWDAATTEVASLVDAARKAMAIASSPAMVLRSPQFNTPRGRNPGGGPATAGELSGHTTASRQHGKPVAPASPATRVVGGQDSGSLPRPQQRIIDAIGWWMSIGVKSPSRKQVGFVAGIKPTGGHFNNTIGPLSSGGLIRYVNDGVELTELGLQHATAQQAHATLSGYHGMIRALLKSGATKKLFDVIVAGGDQEISTIELGRAAGIDAGGGHFNNSIGPLGTLGLIQRRGGAVYPTTLLFPEGLA